MVEVTEQTNDVGETVKDLEFDNNEDSIKPIVSDDVLPVDVSTQKGESEQDYLKEHRYTEQDLAMERGNAKRAREEAEAIKSAYEESLSELESLKQQMQTNTQEKKTLEEMDEDLVDKKVIANINALNEKQAKLEAKNAQLEAKARAYEQAESERQAEAEKARTRERILKPLDEKYGATFRNKAIKMAEQMIERGEVKQPADALDAKDLMEKCYEKLSKEKKPVAPDPGSAAAGNIGGTEIKSGSRQEVLDQMRKNKSWLK